MIKVKINGAEYSIAQHLLEVNYKALIKATTDRQILAAISDIPMDIITLLDIEALSPLLAFLECDEDYSAPEIKCVKVAEETYEKFLEAQLILRRESKRYRQLYFLSQLYHPERKKGVHILSTGINLINQINLFLDSYAELFNEGPTQIEIEAGIEQVNELAPFMTPYTLAGKDLLKMKEILKEPTVVVYSALLCNYREAKYQEELYRLKFPEKK